MILNGTKAFMGLITTGKSSAPTYSIEYDEPLHMSWVFHCVNIQRKKCVLAINAHTRYVVIMSNVKKQDLTQFYQFWLQRLISDMTFLCNLNETQTAKLHDFFMTHYSKCVLYQRNNGSIQTHLNDAVRIFRWCITDREGVPLHESALFSAELLINEIPRRDKYRQDYFFSIDLMKIWTEEILRS